MDALEASAELEPSEHPERVGRYRIERVLGRGSFGLVYLAFDVQLHRSVAVKVPHARLIASSGARGDYLTEARMVAKLDHPHIVPVYDVGSTDDFPCYVVSKYIDGKNLRDQIRETRPDWLEAADLIANVAEALHYAHKCGLVHRDIKPSNILLDAEGRPYVADFGLALSESELGSGPCYVGTPAYMSPEQARAEGHRVDGRSDIYSLGAVFYELLTGRRTFAANTKFELLHQIATQEVRPPRQTDDAVPKELERICLKALSKRASDRYTTASDMAEDLRHFLKRRPIRRSSSAHRTGSPLAPIPLPSRLTGRESTDKADSATHAMNIVPKGLRSFDEHDADFFLALLPGPRDREGMPGSIRFWTRRIEEQDPDKTFSVGLIYGPSGCGKSSLVKAGLLPLLSKRIAAVYIEATADGIEARLLNRIRRHCRDLPEGIGLRDALAAIRRGEVTTGSDKILLVIDQFEQWLHAHRDQENLELVQALRQCEGGKLQCIIMLRDDFWMAITEFLAELEVDLVPDKNVAAVSLFGVRHARRVLAAFGRAYGTIPEGPDLPAECQAFLDEAVAGLAEDGKVVCVRLALLAEMMKEKVWTPATLKEVGGTEGIGVMFLDETFSASTAPPEHRVHQAAARAVLNTLLPEHGWDIRGNMRSYEELQEASGYRRRSRDFERLLEILDTELRLVTPTDPEGTDPAASISDVPDPRGSAHGKYFQLTHDYLVPSLQQWLHRKQRETHGGRAELCLAERTAAWRLHPLNRHLPSWWEYLAICLYTQRPQWSEAQKAMMLATTRYYLTRMLAILLLLFAIGWGVREIHARTKVSGLISSLAAAETAEVPQILTELEPYRRWVIPRLDGPLPESQRPHAAQLHLDLARLRLGALPPQDLPDLQETLLRADPDEARLISSQLGPLAAEMVPPLWNIVNESAEHREILAAATVLAQHAPDDARWQKLAAVISDSLTASHPIDAPEWINNLAPASEHLTSRLREVFRNSASTGPGDAQSQHVSEQRHVAAAALAVYLHGDLEELSRLLVYHASDAHEFQSLLKPLYENRALSAAHMQSLYEDINRGSSSSPDDHEADVPEGHHLSEAAANAIVASLLLEDRWDLLASQLKYSPDRTLRSRLLHRLAELNVSSEIVTRILASEEAPGVRAALLLALGEYPPSAVPHKVRLEVARQVESSLHAADSGEHSAAAWLAQRWQIDAPPPTVGPPFHADQRNWYEGPGGHQLAIVRNPLDRVYAIALHETTIGQYEQFDSRYREDNAETLKQFLAEGAMSDCPVIYTNVYDAMRYCNWLSSRAGISADQLCYETLPDNTLRPKADYLSREGYRIPTLEEWMTACQAGAETAYSFGSELDLLGSFAWYYSNSRSDGQNRARPVGTLKPNALGTFDMHGNVWEWVTGSSSDDWSLISGGSCDNEAPDLVVGRTNQPLPEAREHRIGFRIARTVPESK